MNKPHKVKNAKEEKLPAASTEDTPAKVHADLEWLKAELQLIKDRLDRSPF